MSGTGVCRSYAQVLKEKADKKHSDLKNAESLRIYYLVIKKAEKAAEDGSYSTDLYDDGLKDRRIHAELQRLLKEQGFKTSIAEDAAYTEHAGTTMMYVRVSWE